MIKKELTSIIITAENGLLKFDDYMHTMRDSGSVKFIYDQKTDAEIVRSFVDAYQRMVDELHDDGIEPVSKIKLGKLDESSESMKKLSKSTSLVKLLHDDGQNKTKIKFDITSRHCDITSIEDGCSMSYSTQTKDATTIIANFVNFVCGLNASRKVEKSNDYNEMRNYLAKKYTKPTM